MDREKLFEQLQKKADKLEKQNKVMLACLKHLNNLSTKDGWVSEICRPVIHEILRENGEMK